MNKLASFSFAAAVLRVLAGFLPLLGGTASAAGIKHVLLISVDGLRGDLLEGLLASSPEKYPNFRKLRDGGASTFNARCDYDFSETLPNHCSMVTGLPVKNAPGTVGTGHLYNTNGYSTGGPNIHKPGAAPKVYRVSTFDTVHDRGLSTALYAGKTRLNLLVDSYNATNGREDPVGVSNGRQKIDFVSVADLSTATELASVKQAVVGHITAKPARLRNYSLVHFTDTDTGSPGGGHSVGWGSPAWNGAVQTVDQYLGDIFAALEAETTDQSLKGAVAIVLTADHGGGGGASPGTFGATHTDAKDSRNYTIPLFLWGPGIPAGVDAYTLFRNRLNPGSGRPTASSSVPQPLRNADTANIAMALLGLPVVEGSFYRPEFSASPVIERQGAGYAISWPSFLTNYRLEFTSDPAVPGWTADTGTPVEDSATMTMVRTFPDMPAEPRLFFRLRAPE